MNKTTPVAVIGYVPRASGKHTYIFNTGFLVQEDQDPARCGWYGFMQAFQVHGNVSEALVDAINVTMRIPSEIGRLFDVVRESGHRLAEQIDNDAFPPPTAAEARCVIFDSPVEDHYESDRGVSVYVFPGRFVPVEDPKVRPDFDHGAAFQAAGNFDHDGVCTTQRAVAVQPGLVRFDSSDIPAPVGEVSPPNANRPMPGDNPVHKDPGYLGYVQTANGKPTLVFDTGFLVQGDRQPERCGWYAYKNPHQIGANVDSDLLTTLSSLPPMSSEVGQVMRKVRDIMDNKSGANTRPTVPPNGHPVRDNTSDTGKDTDSDSDDNSDDDAVESDGEDVTVLHAPQPLDQQSPSGRFMLFDAFDPVFFSPSPIYVFAGPIVWVGGRHPVAFDEQHALAAVGGFDGTGKPTQKRALALRDDIVRFG